MRKVLWAPLRQALGGTRFWVGVLGTLCILLLSSVQNILMAFRMEGLLVYGFHNSLMQSALRSEGMTLALPILAALPFTASFVDDVKSGFVKYYLHRIGRGGYLAGRCVACAFSGGLVLAFGILAAYFLFSLVFLPMEAPLSKDAAAPAYFGKLMESVLLFFFSGAFWSLCGLAFSTLTNSKYMAYASPFVLYYVLIILHERYFDALYVLYPKEWTAPSPVWMWGNWGVILLLFELILMMSFLFASAARRRLCRI